MNHKERRRYQRYDTQMRVFFRVQYDIHTKIKFQIIDATRNKKSLRKYNGISKNISVEGLCFTSRKQLTPHDILLLELYVPHAKRPVRMEYRLGVQMALVP